MPKGAPLRVAFFAEKLEDGLAGLSPDAMAEIAAALQEPPLAGEPADFREAILRSTHRPPGTSTPLIAGLDARSFYGIVFFVGGPVDYKLLDRLRSDMWQRLRRALTVIEAQLATGHSGDGPARRSLRVEVSVIERHGGSDRLVVQISVSGVLSTVSSMLQNALRSLPSIVDVMEREGAQSATVTEKDYSGREKLARLDLWFSPPSEVLSSDESARKQVKFVHPRGRRSTR